MSANEIEAVFTCPGVPFHCQALDSNASGISTGIGIRALFAMSDLMGSAILVQLAGVLPSTNTSPVTTPLTTLAAQALPGATVLSVVNASAVAIGTRIMSLGGGKWHIADVLGRDTGANTITISQAVVNTLPAANPVSQISHSTTFDSYSQTNKTLFDFEFADLTSYGTYNGSSFPTERSNNASPRERYNIFQANAGSRYKPHGRIGFPEFDNVTGATERMVNDAIESETTVAAAVSDKSGRRRIHAGLLDRVNPFISSAHGASIKDAAQAAGLDVKWFQHNNASWAFGSSNNPGFSYSYIPPVFGVSNEPAWMLLETAIVNEGYPSPSLQYHAPQKGGFYCGMTSFSYSQARTWLERGGSTAIAVGVEPLADGISIISDIFRYLLAGAPVCTAKILSRSSRYCTYQSVVGDPLYRPFGKNL
jgi:hypothetical protein